MYIKVLIASAIIMSSTMAWSLNSEIQKAIKTQLVQNDNEDYIEPDYIEPEYIEEEYIEEEYTEEEYKEPEYVEEDYKEPEYTKEEYIEKYQETQE